MSLVTRLADARSLVAHLEALRAEAAPGSSAAIALDADLARERRRLLALEAAAAELGLAISE